MLEKKESAAVACDVKSVCPRLLFHSIRLVFPWKEYACFSAPLLPLPEAGPHAHSASRLFCGHYGSRPCLCERAGKIIENVPTKCP